MDQNSNAIIEPTAWSPVRRSVNFWTLDSQSLPGSVIKGATSRITHLEKIGKFFQVRLS